MAERKLAEVANEGYVPEQGEPQVGGSGGSAQQEGQQRRRPQQQQEQQQQQQQQQQQKEEDSVAAGPHEDTPTLLMARIEACRSEAGMHFMGIPMTTEKAVVVGSVVMTVLTSAGGNPFWE